MSNEETFIMVSLEDQKSKELANVISNDTSRKILEYLGKKESTESELSKDLNIPLSTIHYNIRQLIKTGLIESKEFLYSEKGNKVNIYTAAKKVIVISQGKTNKWKESIKELFSLIFLSLGASFIIEVASKYFFYGRIQEAKGILEEKTVSAGLAGNQMINQNLASPHFGLWFFIGALFIILVSFVAKTLKKK